MNVFGCQRLWEAPESLLIMVHFLAHVLLVVVLNSLPGLPDLIITTNLWGGILLCPFYG